MLICWRLLLTPLICRIMRHDQIGWCDLYKNVVYFLTSLWEGVISTFETTVEAKTLKAAMMAGTTVLLLSTRWSKFQVEKSILACSWKKKSLSLIIMKCAIMHKPQKANCIKSPRIAYTPTHLTSALWYGLIMCSLGKQHSIWLYFPSHWNKPRKWSIPQ